MRSRQSLKDWRVFRTEATNTVVSVHSQFAELKSAANSLLAYVDSLDRSYLTPTEEEATRRLQVSYWQLRQALLEVVFELRERAANDKSEYRELFLPGYAGALVLLDAARYLREVFHQRKLIREKLNEAEPAFGIPSGVYDTVQSSWTRPAHIWSLFEAARYFATLRGRWDSIIDDEQRPLLGIIEQLSSRLQLTWSDYAKVRLRFRVRQLWSYLKGDLLGSAMFQIQKSAGILAADKYLKFGHVPVLPDSIQQALVGLLQPADILLVRKEYALTNYFLPGYWPHSALYLGTKNELETMGQDIQQSLVYRFPSMRHHEKPLAGLVMEAMKDGVRIRGVESPFASDSILVIRPTLREESIHQVICRAILHEGKEYDFMFDFAVATRLVCTEVIYRSMDGLEGLSFPLTSRAGRMTLASEDIVQQALAGRGLEIRATYLPSISDQLLVGDDAFQRVRRIAKTEKASTLGNSNA